MKVFKLLLLLLFISVSTYGQETDSRFVAKWQQREESGSDGANKYTVPVKNGPVIIFAEDNGVTYNGAKGKYIIGEGNKLTIDLEKDKHHFLFSFGKNNTILYLTPVTSGFQIICDEGCADIFYKASN